MKIKTFVFAVALCGLVGAGAALACPPPPKYEHQATTNLVAFVEAAAALLKQKGAAALPELAASGGKWNRGDRYIFVVSRLGKSLVNGPFPGLVGKNLRGVTDAAGYFAVREYLDFLFIAKKKSFTWVHYLWPRPGQPEPSWKSSYVARVRGPAGKWYAVGAGAYDLPMERYFVVLKVYQAAALIRKKGRDGLAQIRDRRNGFVFKNTYVFVDSAQGVELVNPAFPGLEGRNLMRLTDATGLPPVKRYLQAVKNKKHAWVSYYWPRPGQKKPALKHTFVKSVGLNGQVFVVGCGLYLD